MRLDYRVQVQTEWLPRNASFGWSWHPPSRQHRVKYLRLSMGRAALQVTVRNLGRRIKPE